MSAKDEQKKENGEMNQPYARILSHQLKSPILAIQTLLKTVSDGFTGEVDPKTLHIVERAIQRASEASNVIADLLDLEMYTETPSAAKEEFDLTRLFDSLVSKYASLASEKGIALRSSVPLKKRVYLIGDNRSLYHALRNIFENAIHYTPSDGTIVAGLDLAQEGTCRVQIADSGYGIAADEFEHIFDPFYRSLRHKQNIPGTGLGLSISRKVVSNHMGTIAVESKEGQGSTFTITLPYSRTRSRTAKARGSKRVVIIGGATAGPKTAARLRRLDESLDITIVEKSEFLSYSGCGLPYYISGKVSSARSLMSTADNTIRDVNFFESIKNITALNNTVALEIDREAKRVKIQDLGSRSASHLPYDFLVLATGAQAVVPQIPGIQQQGIYALHSIEDADAIKRELSQKDARDVLILGGGPIGVGTAESLVDAGARVTILEKQSHILGSYLDDDIAVKIQNEMNKNGIKTITEAKVVRIERSKDHFMVVTEEDSHAADLIILSAGVRPNIALAQSTGLEIGCLGGVRVNNHLQTSDDCIFAIGDCVESQNAVTGQYEYWPLGSIATKMGRIAADNICGRKSEYRGSIGTAMFKIFDTNVARTGLNSRDAVRNGYQIETAIVSGLDRVHYGKNAQPLSLKLIADRNTRVVLGGQGYGRGDIPAKIEILSCAITQSLTLDQVFKLDLGYAPAFNSPIDIAQTACLVLDNKLDKLVRTISWEQLDGQKGTVIIDVRPLSEYSVGSIPGSINIPLENIRLEEIPYERQTRVVLYSKTSSGAYEAYKYLTAKGYTNLFVLEGGLLFWED